MCLCPRASHRAVLMPPYRKHSTHRESYYRQARGAPLPYPRASRPMGGAPMPPYRGFGVMWKVLGKGGVVV